MLIMFSEIKIIKSYLIKKIIQILLISMSNSQKLPVSTSIKIAISCCNFLVMNISGTKMNVNRISFLSIISKGGGD